MVCPNPELLSAWHDAEVPSPWKEALQQHIQSCTGCTAKLENIRRLSAGLQADVSQAQTNQSEVSQRVLARLQANVRQIQVKPSLLRRHLVLPLPVAAAAAVLVALMGLALLSSGRRNSQLMMAVQQAEEAHQMASSNMGMEAIIDYLARQETGVSITISLPQSSGFVRSGDPFIVREADFRPAGGNK